MRRSDGERAKLGALGEHPVLGRRLAEDVHPLALDQLQALGRVEAAVVDHRRRAAEPRSDEHVARRLRPPRRRRAPDELARLGPQPVLGLGSLAGQVAVGVQRPARLAGRPRGEDDQGAVVRLEVGDVARAAPGGAPRPSPARRRPSSWPARRPAARRAAPPRRRRAPGPAALTRSSRSWRRSCVLQGSAIAPIRQHASIVSTHSIRLPTSVITTSPRPTPRAANAPDSPALRGDQLPEAPHAALPVARDRDQRRSRRWEPLEHVLDEVHGGVVCRP